ncbi:ImmA/IrrE family metallo-endopeptidase [Oceanobacillus oncorhynchi]|uniref:ImmA/IrrE family metallo-endopeptidase n=1 Tax=Oceanobacillus oncorhynchi TaxID=545501 RepID=UPI0018689CE9|nr:ImmA/IrrE family metallo-endopeptidase [Oceanobacillus oncorhynchi]
MTINKKVSQLVEKYNTSDPFKLAEAMDIEIIYENLGKSFGYFSRLYRTAIIHLNENLPLEKQKSTCAHELGHIVLHPEINTAFLKTNTYYPTSGIELEANEFMVELLFLQGGDEIVTINEAIEDYKVPEQLLYKKF